MLVLQSGQTEMMQYYAGPRISIARTSSSQSLRPIGRSVLALGVKKFKPFTFQYMLTIVQVFKLNGLNFLTPRARTERPIGLKLCEKLVRAILMRGPA